MVLDPESAGRLAKRLVILRSLYLLKMQAAVEN
jgi:hypothetical protein